MLTAPAKTQADGLGQPVTLVLCEDGPILWPSVPKVCSLKGLPQVLTEASEPWAPHEEPSPEAAQIGKVLVPVIAPQFSDWDNTYLQCWCGD